MTQDKRNEKNEEKKLLPLEPEAKEKPTSADAEKVMEKEAEETVTIPLKEYAAQMEQIDQLENQINDLSDGWQRERADFSNYRRRIERDHAEVKQNILVDVVKKYLAIHDDIDLALKNVPNHPDSQSWVEGIQLIDQKLRNILEAEGVQRIPAENELFDPNRHEAIATEENNEFESGRVIEIVRQGYIIGDRVIRPARVKIAK